MDKVVLVIPVYNPIQDFSEAIFQLAQGQFYKVVVVNDGCDKNYDSAFKSLKDSDNIIVLKHDVNKGKGGALKTAFHYILDFIKECSGIVTADADGQHKMKDIIAVRDALLQTEGSWSIVLGSRNFDQKTVPFRNRVGNIITRMILKYLCNFDFMDTQTGLRGIPAGLLEREVNIAGDGYEYETNVLLDAVDAGIEFIEIPIETVYENGNNVSHFNPLKDSIRIYRTILLYSGSSLIASLLDYVIFIVLYAFMKNLWVATYIGRCCAAVVNFTINRKAVFKDGDKIWKSLSRYVALLLVSGTTSALLLQISSFAFGNVYFTVKVVIEIGLYFFNYYFQKNFVFRKKNK